MINSGGWQMKNDWRLTSTEERRQDMARLGSGFIDTDDKFPEMDLQLTDGSTLKLPAGTGEGYAVILLYRGYWWPFCSQQLADFQSSLKELDAEGIKVIAGSVDPIEKTKEYADKLGITYTMAYGMDAEAVSDLTGAFYEKEKKFIQPTGFLLRPDKTIEVAVYCSCPVGRFVAQDVLKLVRYYKSLKKK